MLQQEPAGSRPRSSDARSDRDQTRRFMTKATLKPLNQQAIVITGATSGIGLADGAAGGQGRGLRLPDRARRRRPEGPVRGASGRRGPRGLGRRRRRRPRTPWPRRPRNACACSAASTPGSTTPASRSSAPSARPRWRTSAGCSRPTTGAWSTARWSRRSICATRPAAGPSSTSAPSCPTRPCRSRASIRPPSTR